MLDRNLAYQKRSKAVNQARVFHCCNEQRLNENKGNSIGQLKLTHLYTGEIDKATNN